MSKNRGVVYVKPGLVEVQDIADPKFEDPHGRKINHAVILKIVSTNICGSDQHMVRGRTCRFRQGSTSEVHPRSARHRSESDLTPQFMQTRKLWRALS
jgi:threonine dehydrogenase-like Zn-dependent dehydrogenase